MTPHRPNSRHTRARRVRPPVEPKSRRTVQHDDAEDTENLWSKIQLELQAERERAAKEPREWSPLSLLGLQVG